MTAAGRVAVVSTVKDTVAATEHHVERNLRAGADHVFLFVDDADPAVCRRWEDHPCVTVVPTDDAYWDGKRPDELARRQGINANLVNLTLTVVPEATWLFSLDADECLHIDRQALLELDDAVRVIRLTTWEAASRTDAGAGPQRYKRPLEDEELEMLVLLGALATPDPGLYFRGHRKKIGIRPDRKLRMFLHRAENMRGKTVPMHADPARLRVLHDESPTIEEFIRKWGAHIQGGGVHGSRQRRIIRRIILAVEESHAAQPQQKRAVLERLYGRVAVDDVEVLESLGFLEVPDHRLHQHEAMPFTPTEHDRMRTMLDAMRGVDKSMLLHIPRPRPVQALRQAHQRLDRDSELAQRVRATFPAKKDGPADERPSR